MVRISDFLTIGSAYTVLLAKISSVIISGRSELLSSPFTKGGKADF